MRLRNLLLLIPALLFTSVVGSVLAEEAPAAVSLQDGLRPFLQMMSGRESTFELTGTLQIRVDQKVQPVNLTLSRFNDHEFDLRLTHPDYAVEIQRRRDVTAIILPLHNVAFVGRGDVEPELSLAPRNILTRIVSRFSNAAPLVNVFSSVNPEFIDPLILLVKEELKAVQDEQSGKWTLTESSPVSFPVEGQMLVSGEFGEVRLALSTKELSPVEPSENFGVERIVPLSRTELEQTLSRGVHRATEVLAPSVALRKPRQQSRTVPHGELRWVEGHRVALLNGSPQEIGTAHGLLLPEESRRCVESVLYSFGTVHAIRTGQWFRHDLEEAYARLAPHIPERHKVETRALASALDFDASTLELLNVFPELFHCSGFAVFGSATMDGKLLHGRVLDYMTTIGLQDAATTFIVRPDGYTSFANIGYAAFIGSVSGMNANAISLGEMGGRGEGNWDGVPMATLMRRALEECSTLEDVKTLWANSPRTCEYYYVFADGKTNEAVGVAALPESIEFINPGQSHERLGSGIPDAVVLSAGSRLEKLRERVQEKHGQIDAEVGMWLMSRPVAMQSNLHNVLFVPADGVFYVANASHSGPAAEQPYVRLNLRELTTEASAVKISRSE